MADDSPTTEHSAVDPSPAESNAAPETKQTQKPPGRMQSFGADWRSSRAAQILSAILAVIVIGGIGYGIGYAVGDSGHHGGGHGRHGDHHMTFRDGGGPGGPGMRGFDHMRPGGQMPGGPMSRDQRGPDMGNAPATPASPAAPPATAPAPAQP